MAQVQATFAVPSICSLHPALNTHPNLVQAYNLNASKAQNGIIASRDVREAEETVSMLQAAQAQHPAEITEDVIQTAKNRVTLLSELHSHSEFQVANTLTGIQNTLNNLQTMVQNGFDRLEARLENMKIVQANHLQLQSNTAYLSRQKQISGDGTAKANALRPANIAQLNPYDAGNVPPPGATSSPTINPYALNSMQILNLIRFYNEDFGILGGDGVEQRKHKLANWLTQTTQA